MKTLLFRLRYGACALVLGACRSAVPEGTSAPAPSLASAAAPCTAKVKHVDVSSWREIRMPTFLVCLPEEWKLSGPMWRRGAATIRWGIGTSPDPEGRQSGAVTLSTIPDDRRTGEAAGDVIRRFGEMIGGNWADFWRSGGGGTYRTGVQWVGARVWFAGQSSDARTADLQLNIYRTVRFVAP